MHACDAIAWIPPDGCEMYCDDCCMHGIEGNTDPRYRTKPEGFDRKQWSPVFADSETDSPTHCAQCDELIPESLTGYGAQSVIDAILAGEAPQAWVETYDYLGKPCTDCGCYIVDPLQAGAYDECGWGWHLRGCPETFGDRPPGETDPAVDLPPYDPWKPEEECEACGWYLGEHSAQCDARPWQEWENRTGPTMRLPFP